MKELSKSLYQITDELKTINDMLDDSGGELTPALELHQKDIAEQIQNKCDGIANFKSYLDDCLEVIIKRRKDTQELEKSFKLKIDRFKDYIYGCMRNADIKKIDTPLSRITIAKARKSLVVDESLLDKKYINSITTFKVDTDQIKQDLDNGVDVTGASYELGKEPVLIKRKG